MISLLHLPLLVNALTYGEFRLVVQAEEVWEQAPTLNGD